MVAAVWSLGLVVGLMFTTGYSDLFWLSAVASGRVNAGSVMRYEFGVVVEPDETRGRLNLLGR